MGGVILILIVLAAAAGATTLAFRFDQGRERSTLRSLATVGFAAIGALLVASGISGILGSLIPAGDIFRSNTVALARSLAYLAVGGPLLIGLWRQFGPWLKEPKVDEGWLIGWPLVTLWSLIGTAIGLSQTIGWVVGGDPSPRGVGRLVGWGALLYAATSVERRTRSWLGRSETRPLYDVILPILSAAALVAGIVGIGLALTWLVGGDEQQLGLGVGAAWGLVWFATYQGERKMRPDHDATVMLWGLVTLTAATITTAVFLTGLFDRALDRLTDTPVIGDAPENLAAAAVWMVWAVAGWWWLWLRDGVRRPDSVLKQVFALTVGVGISTVSLIASTAGALFLVLEWILGTPETARIRDQFEPLPPLLAIAVVAGGVLLHHRQVAHVPSPPDRPARYIVAGAGLGAAASGLTSVIVAALISLGGDVAAGDTGIDVLLAGGIAMIVGGLAWWTQWNVLEARITADGSERLRPSRKTYMGIVLVVMALAALVSAVTVVFGMFRAVLGESRLLTETFSSGIAVLLTSVVIGSYHWKIWKHDRAAAPAPVIVVPPAPPREVMVITGGDSSGLQAALATPERRLWVWHSAALGDGRDAAEIEQAISGSPGSRILVIERSDGIEVIELDR